MTKLPATGLWALAIAAILLAWPNPAFACTCMTPDPPLEALAEAEAVFVGIVLDADGPYPIPVGEGAFRESGRWFRLRVLSSWKGAERETVVVRTGSGGGDCGYDFELGQTYFVYAHRSRTPSDTLSTSICSRTTPVPWGAEDSVALGAPRIDRTAGRAWRSSRAGAPCPLHGAYTVASGHTFTQFDVTPSMLSAYRNVADQQFPYAGIQFDRPSWDVGAAKFRGLNRALVCDLCRAKAREWLCHHGVPCPEFEPETEKDDERRSRIASEADYRAVHPMKRFAFLFDDGRDLRVDTIEGRLTRRVRGERNKTVACAWTEPELRKIYEQMIAMRFFDLPAPHPTYYVPDPLRTVGESAEVQLFARSDTTVHQLHWNAAYTTKDRESMVSDWPRLYALIALIRETLAGKPEYATLFSK